jgi:hypothetical protein
MASKKITLTNEHILLIQNIDFHAFEFGEELPIEPIIDAMNEIKEMPKNEAKKFSRLNSILFDIKNRLNEYNDEASQNGWGINQWNMFGGTYVMEDVAMITGHYDEAISDDGASGKEYPKELEDHMWDLYLYITNNMEYIMKLVLWSISNGGLTPGTYKTTDKGISWTKE